MEDKNSKSDKCSSCGQKKKTPKDANTILKSKIDVKAGDLTFGQRIDLGEVFQSSENEAIKFERVFECLHKYKPKIAEYIKLIDYFKEVAEGIMYWLEQENTMLAYEPSSEELAAGVKELTVKIGNYGTIKALAKAYSKDPDEILEWKYGKVFGILYTDLEEHKYQQAYNKVLERKNKTK